jgi:hypothetical protein
LAFDTDSPYGVVAFIPSETRWDAMRDARIAWARCDFTWRMVETSKGVFNWSTTDDEVFLVDGVLAMNELWGA